jgi:hypothetical protein
VLAGLLQGRRRIKVEVADPALTPTARGFNHYKMAEFVELMILPLASTLESLRQAEQNRCKPFLALMKPSLQLVRYTSQYNT